ncbi:hypothetical protein BJV78DRAFT_1157801 [Lactifluus subvellereus]|nr:hypothetical protein BJV78DRAFT_1157801 [Lactifluus subvellereus]
MPMDNHSLGSEVINHVVRRWKGSDKEEDRGQVGRHVTIETLPDNVLLEIFDFYRFMVRNLRISTWHWRWLLHVCRRWRYIMFASPHRLELRLRCTPRTPVRETMAVWPTLPIIVDNWPDFRPPVRPPPEGGDNLVAVLEHHDRVSWIRLLGLTSRLLAQMVTVMQEPFLTLKCIQLGVESNDDMAPVLPSAFLGGSAPYLQLFRLEGIPFPTLPKLLSSAGDLTEVRLERIPNTGYISPEAMATCLSTLINLQFLTIEFQSPSSCPNQRSRRSPPLTRAILPALAEFQFRGVSEYLEDFVARIDAPHLRLADITFFNQLIIDVPLLPWFIGRAEKLKPLDQATVIFGNHTVAAILAPQPQGPYNPYAVRQYLMLRVSCKELDWQVSSIAQIYRQFLPIFSGVERLHINDSYPSKPDGQDDMDRMQWLELLHLFPVVETLRISKYLRSFVMPALNDLTGEWAVEVLPALRNLYLMGMQPSVQEVVEPFVAARQLSDHPVTVHYE